MNIATIVRLTLNSVATCAYVVFLFLYYNETWEAQVWWSWVVLAVPLLFLAVEFICRHANARWGYFPCVLWAGIWLVMSVAAAALIMGAEWFGGGRSDLVLFPEVFFWVSLTNATASVVLFLRYLWKAVRGWPATS